MVQNGQRNSKMWGQRGNYGPPFHQCHHTLSVATYKETVYDRSSCFKMDKEILLPSAVHLEERLTVSQSVPQPASRQSDRYTQFGFFVSGRCGFKQQGGSASQSKQWPSGNAAGSNFCSRRFEPQTDHFGAAAGGGAKSQRTGIRTNVCAAGASCVTIGPLAV